MLPLRHVFALVAFLIVLYEILMVGLTGCWYKSATKSFLLQNICNLHEPRFYWTHSNICFGHPEHPCLQKTQANQPRCGGFYEEPHDDPI